MTRVTAGNWMLVAVLGLVLLGGWVDVTFVPHGSRCLDPVTLVSEAGPTEPVTRCPPPEPRHPRLDLAIWLGLLGGGGTLLVAGITGAVVAAAWTRELARISTLAGMGATDESETAASVPGEHSHG